MPLPAEFKSLTDYDTKARPTLHYILKYDTVEDLILQRIIDNIIENITIDVVEYKVAKDENKYYILLKFNTPITVPNLVKTLKRSFGDDELDKFTYSKVSSMKRGDTEISKDLTSIQSQSYLNTEKRKATVSKELLAWNRKKSNWMKQKKKSYVDHALDCELVGVNMPESMDMFLEKMEKTFLEDNPKPEK